MWSYGQDHKKNKLKVDLSGYIKLNAYLDSYKSVYARDGDIYLYPLQAAPDSKGADLNKNSEFNILASQTRFRIKTSGNEAFGAKINSTIEVDFYGTRNDLVRTMRMRHAFFNMNWGNTQLLFGQTWHPLFTVECFPEVLSMGAALPFNPLSRAPQIRLTKNFNKQISGLLAVISHNDFRSPGNVDAQKNAIIPDIHGELKYKSEKISLGAIAGYKVLRPRLSYTDTNSVSPQVLSTDKTIGSFDVAGYLKFKSGALTLKSYGIYGQNLGPYVMLGGYGASSTTDLDGNGITGDNDYNYVNINTMAVWTEFIYTQSNFHYALFAGYSKNLGVDNDNYFSVASARNDNIDNILRISPRIAFTSGKVMLGFEYMYATATYVKLKPGKFIIDKKDDVVANHRFFLTAQYSF